NVRVPDRANLRFPNGLTTEAWINPSALGVSQGIITKWGDSQKTFSFAITADNRLYLLVSGSGTDTGSTYALSSNTIAAMQWTHVAGTYDNSNVRVYLNGALQGQVSYSQILFPGTNDLAIGGDVEGPPPSVIAPFSVQIVEPAIYVRSLSGAEIKAM